MIIFFERNKDKVDELQLSIEDINLIMDLVLYKGSNLVVGSVASPIISSCIMNEFDIRLGEFVEKQGIKYTRYADDIVISSQSYIDCSILTTIDTLLKEYGFKRNVGKTYFMSKHQKREVTGIVLDNNDNSLSLGHKKYVELKRAIYNYLVKEIGNVNQINGMLAYLKDVNMDRYISLKKTYTRYDKKNEFF